MVTGVTLRHQTVMGWTADGKRPPDLGKKRIYSSYCSGRALLLATRAANVASGIETRKSDHGYE